MPAIRILLLMLVLGSLALLALQNLSPVLALVFLGAKTQALPVGVWILAAIALGALTGSFLQLLSYLQRRPLQTRIRTLEAAETPRPSQPRRETAQSTSSTQQTSYTPPPPPQESNPDTDGDDWEDEVADDDDWDESEEPRDRTPSPQPFAKEFVEERERTTYERQQEPKSASRSGSVYSYSYREPRNSGVGKTEAVYDANYRVITPPYQEPQPVRKTNQDEEDWGFEDEDEFDNDWKE
ncbi:LapA family protein [Coleofasciculus sp. FACHB-1120]|uniref:LapA family protein n=1 Tax=Coleofasciculus sp. FACHB-1120 TaxID=2692783 RepID=UPI0016885040|nr:LapA family protein [Coleofasciculus sp. FACHB-1120]MBD2741140.1 LapA family protein [Coleofasciculus sp. FACHB-1120]